MPKKKTSFGGEERAKRLNGAASEFETSADPKLFAKAYKKVLRPKRSFGR